MQSGCCSGLFKYANSLFSTNHSKPAPIFTIIFDPNVLLIPGPDGKEFEIHPIIQQWLESKANDPTFNIKLVFLAKNNEQKKAEVNICIPVQNEEINYPLDLNFLTDFTSSNAYKFIDKHLWDFDIKEVVIDTDSIGYPFKFSDKTRPPKASILLITKADENAYDHLGITIYKMDTFNQPLLSEPISTVLENSQLEVYSDFDDTLFDCIKFLMLSNFFYKLSDNKQYHLEKNPLLHNSINKLDALFSPDSKLTTVKENTIAFLKTLSDHPITLITQRAYHSDKTQLPCNNVSNIITQINTKYSLNIHYDKESFLDANSQIKYSKEKNNTEDQIFLMKIEQLYNRMISRSREGRELPKEILLIDDDLGEIFKCMSCKRDFELIGIKVIAALIMQPINFSKDRMESLKIIDPHLYSQALELLNEKIEQLNQTFNEVKEATNNRGIDLREDFIEPCSEVFQNAVSQLRG